MDEQLTFNIIATVASPYKEKFAIPRQPGLVSAAQGKILLKNTANHRELVRGLEQFSHIWLLFAFHQTKDKGWKPLVRPPRLGGNKKIGVFATRTTFRPNPIGMSVVKLNHIDYSNKQVIIHISELDLLDGTPLLDIKPYIPYADSIANATAGYAQQAPKKNLSIDFTDIAKDTLKQYQTVYPNLKRFIKQVLQQDPRPAYKQTKLEDKIYGMSLYDLNIQWKLQTFNHIIVLSITQE